MEESIDFILNLNSPVEHRSKNNLFFFSFFTRVIFDQTWSKAPSSSFYLRLVQYLRGKNDQD